MIRSGPRRPDGDAELRSEMITPECHCLRKLTQQRLGFHVAADDQDLFAIGTPVNS